MIPSVVVKVRGDDVIAAYEVARELWLPVTMRGAGASTVCNFGGEKGHYEVSVAVAETHLLQAVWGHADAGFLADGILPHPARRPGTGAAPTSG